MGLFSIIGSIFGGMSASNAAGKAADAQVRAAQLGIDEQRRQFDLTRSDFAPYLAAGTSALGGLGDMVGINGADKMQASIDALRSNPLYASLYRNGEEALLQTAAATGGLRGGNTQAGLADFGSDVLSQVYNMQIGNLGSLAGLGSGAANSVGGFGANAANQISAGLNQQGAARAGQYLTQGGIASQNWQNFGNLLDGGDLKSLLSQAGSLF